MNQKSYQIKISDDIEVFKLNEESIYENGYQLGLMYKKRIDINKYNLLLEKLYQSIKDKYSSTIFNLIKRKIKIWMNTLKSKFRISIEDILGFSDALEIENDVLLEINVIVETYDYMCTLLGVNSKKENIWNLRILDLDPALTDIIFDLNLPLTILIHKVSENVNYTSCCYIGFFNGHTSYINNSSITTFSWNNVELKDFLKNEIPPIFSVKYMILKYQDIYLIKDNLIKEDIIYDAYVMLMDKNTIILHDFNKERNDNQLVNEGNIVISDYSFILSDNIDEFIKERYPKIPSQLRAFGIIYDFKRNLFLVNHAVRNTKFIEIKLDDFLKN